MQIILVVFLNSCYRFIIFILQEMSFCRITFTSVGSCPFQYKTKIYTYYFYFSKYLVKICRNIIDVLKRHLFSHVLLYMIKIRALVYLTWLPILIRLDQLLFSFMVAPFHGSNTYFDILVIYVECWKIAVGSYWITIHTWAQKKN